MTLMIANPHVGCQGMTLKIQQYVSTKTIQFFPKLGHNNQYRSGKTMATMAAMLILAAWRLAVDGGSLRKFGSRLRKNQDQVGNCAWRRAREFAVHRICC
jgi:hypothetical protein